MLTAGRIKTLVEDLPQFTDIDNQIFTASGYDAVIAILERMRDIKFPCIVLEDKSSGELGCIPGGLDTYSVSLWVMGRVERDEDRSSIIDEMFALSKCVVKKLAANIEDPDIAGLDIKHIPYNRRQGGMDCVGFELMLNFTEDISLYDN